MREAQGAQRREPVHDGHLDVENHDVWAELRELVQRDPAIRRRTDDGDVGVVVED